MRRDNELGSMRLAFVLIVVVVLVFVGLFWYKSSQPKPGEGQFDVKDTSNTTRRVDMKALADKLDPQHPITVDKVKAAFKDLTGKEMAQDEVNKVIPDHIKGKLDSKVTVIEYEDFACVHCQAVHSYVDKIHQEYGDRVRFIYRNFSLSYPNSDTVLIAGETAAKLGGNQAFWKMHDLLFQNDMWVSYAVDSATRNKTLTDYAKQSGLDADKFNAEFVNAQTNGVKAKIERDCALGRRMGVNGTPSVYINGKKLDGAVKYETLKSALDKVLLGLKKIV